MYRFKNVHQPCVARVLRAVSGQEWSASHAVHIDARWSVNTLELQNNVSTRRLGKSVLGFKPLTYCWLLQDIPSFDKGEWMTQTCDSVALDFFAWPWLPKEVYRMGTLATEQELIRVINTRGSAYCKSTCNMRSTPLKDDYAESSIIKVGQLKHIVDKVKTCIYKCL